jgi:hypothetical protein
MIKKIADWLQNTVPKGNVAFNSDEGNFIVTPNGEPYEIEIPYLEAKVMMETNGQKDGKERMDELFAYAADEAMDNAYEEDGYDY